MPISSEQQSCAVCSIVVPRGDTQLDENPTKTPLDKHTAKEVHGPRNTKR